VKRTFVLVALALVAAAIFVPVGIGYARHAKTDAGVSVDVVDSLKSQASADQQSALADDVVDDSEYLAAIARTIQCLKDAGIVVYPTTGGKPSEFTFGGTSSPQEQQKLAAVYSDCYNRYQHQIDIVHAQQNARVLTAAQSAAASSDIVACLRAQGLDLADGAPKSIWYETRLTSPAQFGRCANQVMDAYGALP
jgi:hypothetical protein